MCFIAWAGITNIKKQKEAEESKAAYAEQQKKEEAEKESERHVCSGKRSRTFSYDLFGISLLGYASILVSEQNQQSHERGRAE